VVFNVFNSTIMTLAGCALSAGDYQESLIEVWLPRDRTAIGRVPTDKQAPLWRDMLHIRLWQTGKTVTNSKGGNHDTATTELCFANGFVDIFWRDYWPSGVAGRVVWMTIFSAVAVVSVGFAWIGFVILTLALFDKGGRHGK